MKQMKEQYGALLLLLIQREARWRYTADWPRINDLCDRFERVLTSLMAPPLVWEGDNA